MGNDQPAKRVVIAEDQKGMRGLVRELIDEAPGLEVVALATSGDEVLDHVAQKQPDVLILDLGLPVLDGELVLRQLKAAGDQPRIIVLSGQASAIVAPRLLQEGADAVVEKGVPGWENELVIRLREEPDAEDS